MVEVRVQHADTARTISMTDSHTPIVKTVIDGTIETDMRTSVRRMLKNGKQRTISWILFPLRDPADTDIDKITTSIDTIMEHLHTTLVTSI
jgi:hypothetical protein